MSYHGLNMNFICDSCIPKLNAARAADCPPPGSADESSEDDSPNVTCVQVQPTVDVPKMDNLAITSTPKKQKRQRPKRSTAKNTTAVNIKDTSPPSNTPLQKPAWPKEVVRQEPNTKIMPRPEELRKTGDSSRPPREQCLIVVNIPESTDASPQSRVDHDVKELRGCLASLFDSGDEELAASIRVKAAFRLGKRHEAPHDNPRPLKIVLSNPTEAQTILRRAPRLKGQPIRILRDLSPEDRSKLKAALEELRERRANGETNLVLKDFRVVKRKPRIRWLPLSLTSRPLESVNPSQ